MKSTQIGSAAWAPLRPCGSPLSKPTHTSVRRRGPYPTNHASRPSLVVPVLPATTLGRPLARAALPVPDVMTPLSSEVTSHASAADTTCTGSSATVGFTSSSPYWTARIPETAEGRTPPFARAR